MVRRYAGTRSSSTARDQGSQLRVLGGLVEGLAQRGVVGGPGLGEQLQAGLGDVGVDAAPVGVAEIAGQQAAVLEPGDEAGGGALAEDDGVGDLLHLQMAAGAAVLAAEDVEE